LLDVIQLSSATGFFPENVINVFESLFEHEENAAKETYPTFFPMRSEKKG
jgi:hypothetical protein